MKYLEVSKKTFFPSVLSQINKNFILCVIANKQHHILIDNIINEICKDLKKEKPSLVFLNDGSTDYLNYILKENINIQTRHDCDDWMCETYVDQIQKIFFENKDKYNTFVIHGQPYKYDIIEDKKYKMTYRYDPNNTSMFVSVCQKNCDIQLFTLKHSDVGKVGEKVFMVDEGSCHLVIHKNNKLSTINLKKDILIK
jgi:hypothetical protein